MAWVFGVRAASPSEQLMDTSLRRLRHWKPLMSTSLSCDSSGPAKLWQVAFAGAGMISGMSDDVGCWGHIIASFWFYMILHFLVEENAVQVDVRFLNKVTSAIFSLLTHIHTHDHIYIHTHTRTCQCQGTVAICSSGGLQLTRMDIQLLVTFSDMHTLKTWLTQWKRCLQWCWPEQPKGDGRKAGAVSAKQRLQHVWNI